MQSDGSGHGDSPDGVPIPTGATVLLRSGSEIDPLAFAGSWRFERPNLLGVTVDRSIQLFLADWRASVERTPRDVGLVGVGETTRSAVGRQSADDRDGGYAIRTVADPTDLDAVEGHVASLLDGWRTRPEPTVVVVDSVTGLLDVVPKRDAVGFLDDLADLVANGGAVGLLVARSTAAERPLDAVTRPCVDEIEATPDGWRLVESGRPGERPALSAGEVFALLSDGRRRRVLQFLEDRERATVEDLADAIADGTGPYERSRLAGSLVHVHLPRLSDADVVDYDADAGVVEATGAVEHLLSMVELVDSRERE
jgi:DNA-binding transcriptional ArsR family regulator